MFDTVIAYALSFPFTGYMGILLYWLPLSFCVFGYTVRTHENIQKDLEKRREVKENKSGFYSPTDTIGTLIGRGVVSVIPVANMWAAAFDLAPKIFGRFFSFIGKVFDQPLVPRLKDDK